ncbi:hypothetical protein Afil01_18770 [Actinorhabdospora filicis]|uniref:Uncharacterized protein n=1 Tax=Actinorhabdospora filicis TaxID=1785913 RepID=A0A9W6SJF9_9ACTN|nr:hypothetical protein [Actinorhabdospora filicis]GLZ77070.1 hypothetical protein Afil01_18770 [Actinorhabdospora filicis]
MSDLIRELDQLLALQTGVRGYLSYQDGMNRRMAEEFAPILKPTESQAGLLLVNLMNAGKFAVACELKVRENERDTIYTGGSRDDEYAGTAVEFNEQCVRSLERARYILRGLPKALQELPRPDDEVIADGRTAMFRTLAKFNIMPPEFAEVIKIWEETVAPARRGGVPAIFATLDQNLETLIGLRTRADRGNEAHSPLPWWKYVLIAVIIGAALFAIFACFYWGACTWVWPALALVAPWVFGIIDRGC